MTKEAISFNKPYLVGREYQYIQEAVSSRKLSGNGAFTKQCQHFFEHRYGFRKCLLTSSCTDALEMAAILAGIEQGDEVIVPSYTFVSTANAFVLRGAKIIFIDSREDHPGMDEDKIEELITEKTKAIVPVHYAGVACDMDKIMAIAEKHNLIVIEDAAQAIDAFYTGSDGQKKSLGGIGHFGTFSFHETKNIIAGEGGMLVINDDRFIQRSEVIWEKGTNRSAFFRGEIDKYGWVDIGSSFLPSEVTAAFLFAQLEHLDNIQTRRKGIWERYYSALSSVDVNGRLPFIPSFATNNAHMFYLVMNNEDVRNRFIAMMKSRGIQTVFHYIALETTPFGLKNFGRGRDCENSLKYTETLVRLPFFFELTDEQVDYITDSIKDVLHV